MESENNYVLKMIESNERLMTAFSERIKSFEDRFIGMESSLAILVEKVIHLEAMAVQKKLDKAETKIEKQEDKINDLEKVVAGLKVWGTMVAAGIGALVAGAVSLVFK